MSRGKDLNIWGAFNPNAVVPPSACQEVFLLRNVTNSTIFDPWAFNLIFKIHWDGFEHVFTSKNIESIEVKCSCRESALRV